MSEPVVTEADRWKATLVVARLPISLGDYRTRDLDAARDVIAAALAAERAKARAPFLAAADEIHRRGTAEVAAMDDEPDEHRKSQCASRASTYARAEHLIRRAAEED